MVPMGTICSVRSPKYSRISARTICGSLRRGQTASAAVVQRRYSRSACIFREQLLEVAPEFIYELLVVFAGGGAGKPRMNPAHLALTVDDDRGRKAIELLQHR